MSTKRATYAMRQRTRARLAAQGAPCAICGKPIDYTLDWWVDPRDGKRKRHPYSFEYDHAEALANGGSNEWSNAQPAHRICNQRKGKKRISVAQNGSHKVQKTKTIEKVLPNSQIW